MFFILNLTIKIYIFENNIFIDCITLKVIDYEIILSSVDLH